jgi:hypothetical protein
MGLPLDDQCLSGAVQLHVVTVQESLHALSNDASTTGLEPSA